MILMYQARQNKLRGDSKMKMSKELIKINIKNLEEVCSIKMKESCKKLEESQQLMIERNEIENVIEELKEELYREYGEAVDYEH